MTSLPPTPTDSGSGSSLKKRELEYLTSRIEALESLLGREYELRQKREYQQEEASRQLQHLFRQIDRLADEVVEAQHKEVRARFRLRELEGTLEYRIGERLLRDGGHLPGFPRLERRLLEFLPRLRTAQKESRPRARMPDADTALWKDNERIVRLTHRPRQIRIPSAERPRELWARTIAIAHPAETEVAITVSNGGDPDEPGNLKTLEFCSGRPIHLLRVDAGDPNPELTLSHTAGVPAMIHFKLGNSAEEPPLFPRVKPRRGETVLKAAWLAREGYESHAIRFLRERAQGDEKRTLHLFEANRQLENETAWLDHVNAYLRAYDLSPIRLSENGATRFLRLQGTAVSHVTEGPLISVIMSAFNAESTMEFAARSILDQSWQPLELIIVDDASTDRTPEIARELARNDDRVRVIRNRVNLGCEISRNPALNIARGAFITCHDADDWAHPEQLREQIEAMLADGEGVKASRIHMIRMTHEGRFLRFQGTGGVHSPDGASIAAMVSCMYEVTFLREKLGYWDSVRYGGDNEMFRRAKQLLGDRFRTYPRFGRFLLDTEASASNDPVYGAAWDHYEKSYTAWHERLDPNDAQLPFPHPDDQRRFAASMAIVVPDDRIAEALRESESEPRDSAENAEASDASFLLARIQDLEQRLAAEYALRTTWKASRETAEQSIRDLIRFCGHLRSLERDADQRVHALSNEGQRLKNEQAFKLGKAVTSLRSRPLGLLMAPLAVRRVGRESAGLIESASPERSDRPRSFVLSDQPRIVRLENEALNYVVPESFGACEVWIHAVATDHPATLRIELKLSRPRSWRHVGTLAGERDNLVRETWKRQVVLQTGQPLKILSLGGSAAGGARFKLAQRKGKPAVAQLVVRPLDSPSVAPPPSLFRKVKPQPGKIISQAGDLAAKGRIEEAIRFAEKHSRPDERRAIHLLRANAMLRDERRWLLNANAYVREFGLAPLLLDEQGATRFHRLRTESRPPIEQGPLVSVIMCAYNAEQTLRSAANSILRQTWRPLELIIVDDASTDATLAIARELARGDNRVRIHANGVNVGCDVTKSIGLTRATGDYVTSHDADDWAHPQRIENHMEAMLCDGPSVKASRTGSLRMTPEGEFRYFRHIDEDSPDGILSAMLVSAMFEAEFLRTKLGFWDSVRYGADREMYFRARQVLGENYATYFQLSMFCLDLESSESYNPNYGCYGISPTGQAYFDHYKAWHAGLNGESACLPLPHPHENRRFEAPPGIVIPEDRIRQAMQGVQSVGQDTLPPVPEPPGVIFTYSPSEEIRKSGSQGSEQSPGYDQDSAQASDPPRRPQVWMYWTDQGGSGRSPYLDICLETVHARSECDITVCDEKAAREYLPDLPDAFDRLIPPHQADVFRLGMLHKFGGMYLDFDTFVIKSLVPLFDQLHEYELIGTDWRPQYRPRADWSPIGFSVLGPVRPGLRMLEVAHARQLERLDAYRATLLEGGPYPFRWADLLGNIIIPAFMAFTPRSKLLDGAATWFSLVGAPYHWEGDLGHPLRSMEEIGGKLPDTELFSIGNSLLPDEIKRAPVDDLKRQDTILAHLLNR